MTEAQPTVDSPKPYRKPAPCDHATLLTLLHYDPDTGVFVWLPRPVLGDPQVKRWNSRWVGKVAGSPWKGSTSGPYWKLVIFWQVHYAHRIAWFYMTGEWPSEEIDHRDTNGLNNRWENLRQATGMQNHQNMKLTKLSTTGFKGVCLDKRCGRYVAHITIQRRARRIGSFATAEEAHAAYCEAAKKHFGEFARTE